MADYAYLAYIGIFLGVLARTVVPYAIKKAKAGENPFYFEKRYILTMITALAAAWSTASPLIATFDGTTFIGALGSFWAGLMYAGIINTIINAILVDYGPPAPEPPPAPAARRWAKPLTKSER